jgi:HK97 family phage portal protein
MGKAPKGKIMKIFGWKSAGRGMLRPAKARVQQDRLSGIRTYGQAALGEWPRNYEAQMREGYLSNAIAQRAVRLVAEGLASAPLTSSDPDALALVRATSGGQALIETVAAHLLLHGNAYVEILPGPDGAPCELFALRPERVTIEADLRGWPVAFVYKAGEVASRLPAESIMHIRSMHPLDDHYGLGCLGAASGAVAIHNAATKWNKALLDNAARPSGALVYEAGETGTLSAEQFGRLKEELAASFQCAGNAGRPMLLEGGLKWQAMALTPAEMDFAGLKEAAAREIALAFGVPPVLLGLPGDATYANYREANRALWSQGILPLAGKLLDALAEGLRPWFEGLEFGIDLDAVPALAEDRERLWAQVGAAEFLTNEEKRAAVGLVPAAPPEISNKTSTVEFKFNPWHDAEDGRFTFEGQGQRFAGGGGSFGGGGASGKWNKPKAPKPKSDGGGFGGGQSGGGGASVNGNRPQPATPSTKLLAKPLDKPLELRPDIVKTTVPKVLATVVERPMPTIRKISAGGYDFEADAQDRTVRAYGQLRLQPDQPRSRSAQDSAGKPNREPKDHGGHFIAREFGGPEIGYNHFAQNARFNVSEYRTVENKWKKALGAGKRVTVDIRAGYSGHSRRPDWIFVFSNIGGINASQRMPNKK